MDPILEPSGTGFIVVEHQGYARGRTAQDRGLDLLRQPAFHHVPTLRAQDIRRTWISLCIGLLKRAGEDINCWIVWVAGTRYSEPDFLAWESDSDTDTTVIVSDADSSTRAGSLAGQH